MKYRSNRTGEPISLLGFGCMRFAKKAGSIDMAKAEKAILRAYELGVNYYDTAYIYLGSEAALGEILEKNKIREEVSVATKLPQYLIRDTAGANKIFNEELKRLRTGYIDYYLMHHMTDVNQWNRLESIGMAKWLSEKKSTGQIKNAGFSFHGSTEDFLKVLNAYDWDFCQIQYNYIDETTQAGRAGLEAAHEKGIPVIIMEPLRGGRLVQYLPEKAKRILADSPKGHTPASLAFKWLFDQPGVTCVLSGMNSAEMVEENCRTASECDPGCLDEEDKELIQKVKAVLGEYEKVGCTGCRYCMPCPAGVDIPLAFHCYNMLGIEKKFSVRAEYFQSAGAKKVPAFANRCVGCGKCEKHCPQSLPIREKLKEADKALMPGPYKLGFAIAGKFMYGRKSRPAD